MECVVHAYTSLGQAVYITSTSHRSFGAELGQNVHTFWQNWDKMDTVQIHMLSLVACEATTGLHLTLS